MHKQSECVELEKDQIAQIAQARTAGVIEEEPAQTTGRGKRNFLVTWHNYPENWAEVLRGIDSIKEFHGQIERGEESGRLHVQVAIGFKDAKTLTAARKQIPNFEGWFLVAKSWIKVKNYCTKEKTRVGDPVHSNEARLEDCLEGKNYYKWQLEIANLTRTRADKNDRSIYWIWDEDGNAGKTSFAFHMNLLDEEYYYYVNGKAADIKCAVAGVVAYQKKKYKTLANIKLGCIFFNYVRSAEDYISYDGLESIKDRIFFNGKYESGRCMMRPVHVICLANFEPNMAKCSKDRWIVRKLESFDMHDSGVEAGVAPPQGTCLTGGGDPPVPPH